MRRLSAPFQFAGRSKPGQVLGQSNRLNQTGAIAAAKVYEEDGSEVKSFSTMHGKRDVEMRSQSTVYVPGPRDNHPMHSQSQSDGPSSHQVQPLGVD